MQSCIGCYVMGFESNSCTIHHAIILLFHFVFACSICGAILLAVHWRDPPTYVTFPPPLPHLSDAVYREDALCLAAILCRDYGLDWALEVEIQGKRLVHTLRHLTSCDAIH